MAEDLITRARRRRRYSRVDLAELLGRSLSSVDRYLRDARVAYDLFEGGRKFFSTSEVVRFLREDYLAPEAPEAAGAA